jgi:hypothetical protein
VQRQQEQQHSLLNTGNYYYTGTNSGGGERLSMLILYYYALSAYVHTHPQSERKMTDAHTLRVLAALYSTDAV